MRSFTIAVDAMGGDHAPDALVLGAVSALKRFNDLRILLAGRQSMIEPLLAGIDDLRSRIDILPAEDVIDMNESPMIAVRTKKNASVVIAANAVRGGQADAMVSAGSTGAVLACGMFRIGRIRGVERPALAPVLPTLGSPFLLIDSGANVDCQPKYLEQFGLMGSVYMNSVLGVQNPRVGLVNIGTESEKGNKLTREAYERMRNQTSYNFIGNVEARDLFTGAADVVVADGFDGNIILKQTEGLSKAMFKMIKEGMMSSLRAKIGALLVKPALYGLKDKMDYNKVGGAPLLGVNGAVVKAHGASEAQAIENAVAQARQMLIGDVTGKIRDGLAGLEQEG